MPKVDAAQQATPEQQALTPLTPSLGIEHVSSFCSALSSDAVNAPPRRHVDPLGVQFDRSSLLTDPSSGADCKIALGDKLFHAHKAFLAPVSPYFRQVLCADWEEAQQPCVELDIPGAAPVHFEWVLRCLYGAADRLDKPLMDGVMRTAVYLQLRPLVAHVCAAARAALMPAAELLACGVTHAELLDAAVDGVQRGQEGLEALLEVACRCEAHAMQRRLGALLADTFFARADRVAALAALPRPAIVGCFSADAVAHVSDEDALLALALDVVAALREAAPDPPAAGQRQDPFERELAQCIRVPQLSAGAVEMLFRWGAADKDALIAGMAKQRDPNAFPDVSAPPPRAFGVQFDEWLSRGPLAFDAGRCVVSHASASKRAVAVVSKPCSLGSIVHVALELVADKQNDEGSVFGVVSRDGVGPEDYRFAAGPLWRAYNGEVRLEQKVLLQTDKVHRGDIVGITLDGCARRIEFSRNGRKTYIKEDVPPQQWPLCPAVWFYGNSEKVALRPST